MKIKLHVRVHKACREFKGQLVLKALLALMAQWGRKGNRGPSEQLVLKALLERLVPQARLVLQALLERLVPQVRREQLVLRVLRVPLVLPSLD